MASPLKIERIKKDLKQWQLARLIGINQTDLSNYELGKRRCPANIRYKLARELGISVDILFPDERSG